MAVIKMYLSCPSELTIRKNTFHLNDLFFFFFCKFQGFNAFPVTLHGAETNSLRGTSGSKYHLTLVGFHEIAASQLGLINSNLQYI